jgi:hypothetical protein
MENPLAEPVPIDVFQRVQAFARDLAYGVSQGFWHSKLYWNSLHNPEISNTSKLYAHHLGPKWENQIPSDYLLLSFGYLTLFSTEGGSPVYLLTEKTFSLLERPSRPPDIFISYRRSESSALALLIEARLKLAGNPNPFLDKNLAVGQEWQEQLRERIYNSRYFICLIGEKTLESQQVQQEIQWAIEAGCTIISIWHGSRINAETPAFLRDRHAIIIKDDGALDYEVAINQMLNTLGYATY